MGGVADHMLSFRELGAGLRAPQHHPAPTDSRVCASAARARPRPCRQQPCPHLLMSPSAESRTRGGSQYTVAVSFPGSAMRSRESGQRILGGSRSAQGEERDSRNLRMPWLSYESGAPAPVWKHPRASEPPRTCCKASTEPPSAGLVPGQQGQGSRGREVQENVRVGCGGHLQTAQARASSVGREFTYTDRLGPAPAAVLHAGAAPLALQVIPGQAGVVTARIHLHAR